MSIITKHLEERIVGRRHSDRQFLDIKIDEKISHMHPSSPDLVLYRISFRCAAQYACFPKNTVEARKIAIRQLHEELYYDVRQFALRIQTKLIDRDWRGAMAELDVLFNMIHGEDVD